MTNFENRDVFVTGGTGFIGAHLVQKLLEEGARVYVLARNVSDLGGIECFRRDLRLVKGHLLEIDEATVQAIRPEYVFHLAAHGVEQPNDSVDTAVQVNVQGTCNLLKTLLGKGGERLQGIAYTGTGFEYGRNVGQRLESHELKPTNYYSATKAAGWMLCSAFVEAHDLPIVGVRPFLTYGPNQGSHRLVPYVIISALLGRMEIKLTEGAQTRDFIYVTDIVEGLLKAIQTPKARGEIINLGTGTGTSLRTAVDLVIKLTGSRTTPLYGALPYREGEIWDLRADISKAQFLLKWSPVVPLEEGLSLTIDWYRATMK